MEAWKRAVLTRNARAVGDMEAAYREEPERFREGLMRLAEHDPEARVRSFSTRMLGKLARKECFDLFVKLLAKDPSRHVRENAAWALGELGPREAEEPLRRAEREDAEPVVRAAAAAARKRLKG